MTTQRRFALSALLFALSGCTAIVDGRQQASECLADTDCPTTNVCEGPRVCNQMNHQCEAGTSPPNCDDSEPCTTDTCDPATVAGCVHTLADVDMDGYASQTCADTVNFQGGDCNDADTGINPGVQEDCSTVADDNCNGVNTDAPATITCYADADGDGFHNPAVSTSSACSCPAGYIQPNAIGPDCADGVAEAFPGQTLWFTRPYCRSGSSTQPSVMSGASYICVNPYTATYDYNCVNSNEQINTRNGTSCQVFFNGSDPGVPKATLVSTSLVTSLVTTISTIIIQRCYATWDSGSTGVPACGAYGNQWTCTNSSCNASTSSVQMSCH